MRHQKLRDLKQHFTTCSNQRYGWLESTKSAPKKLILIHGVTGGKEDMLPLAIEYEKQGYYVYCLDLPGHGESAWVDGISFEYLAEWLSGFFELVGMPDLLISNSFSSAIVYAYLQKNSLPAHTHVILGCPTPDISHLSRGLYKVGSFIPDRTGWYLYTTAIANIVRLSMASKKPTRSSVLWLFESEWRKRSTILPHAGIGLSTLLFVENPYDGPLLPDVTQKQMTIVLGTRDNVVMRRTPARLKQLLPLAHFIPAHGSGHILHFEAYKSMKKVP